MAELWTRYALKAIVQVIERGAHTIEVTHAAFDASNAQLDAANKAVIWESHGKGFYYLTEQGRSVVNSPFRVVDVYRMLLSPDPADFEVR